MHSRTHSQAVFINYIFLLSRLAKSSLAHVLYAFIIIIHNAVVDIAFLLYKSIAPRFCFLCTTEGGAHQWLNVHQSMNMRAISNIYNMYPEFRWSWMNRSGEDVIMFLINIYLYMYIIVL